MIDLQRIAVKSSLKVLGVLCVLSGALSAEAQTSADLRGKWIGTLRCRAFNGTRLKAPSASVTMNISQIGRYFAAQIEDSSGVRTYNGEVIRETGRATRFEAVLIECRSTANMNNYSETATIKGFAEELNGRLAGESIFRSVRGEIGTCRWTYERVSKKDPRVSFCR